DDRSLNAQSAVAPMFLVLRVAGPLTRDPETADVADVAVDDRHLAVIAIVETPEVAERERMKEHEMHAGFFHQLLELAFHLVAARRVDEQSHFDALLRFHRQRVRELVADRSRPP